MNIAFFTPQFIVGGAETYIIRKSQWLISKGHSVIIISQGGEMVTSLPVGVKHYTIDGLMRMPYYFSSKRVHKIINEVNFILEDNNIDVVEAHNTEPIIYMILAYAYNPKPFILNVLLELAFASNKQLQKVVKLLSKKGLYFTLNETMNAYIERAINSKLFPIVLPIPITGNNSQMSTHSKSDYLLTVGRIAADKLYLKYLIRGFENYIKRKEFLNVKYLYIVGDGPLMSEIEDISSVINENLGYCAIQLKGVVLGEELDKLYENCYAYIGVGTTLLIGASYGKPTIIASGLSHFQYSAWGFWGMRPDIDKHSITGNTLYKDYAISFEDAISQLNDDNFYQLVAKKARSLFDTTYDIELIMEEWEKYYEEKSKMSICEDIIRFSKILFVWNRFIHILYVGKKIIQRLFERFKG